MLSGEIKSNYENIWVITVNIKDSRIGGIYGYIAGEGRGGGGMLTMLEGRGDKETLLEGGGGRYGHTTQSKWIFDDSPRDKT